MLHVQTSSFSLSHNKTVADSHGSEDDVNHSYYKSPKGPDFPDPYLPVEMRSERTRLQTFHIWPLVSAKKLARYGFYSGKEADCITCAFCGLEICGVSCPQEVKLWHWQVSGKDCPIFTGLRDSEATMAKMILTRTLSKERGQDADTNQITDCLQFLKSPSHVSESGLSLSVNTYSSFSPLMTSSCVTPMSLLRDSASENLIARCGASDCAAIKSGRSDERTRQGRTDSDGSNSVSASSSSSGPSGSVPLNSSPSGSAFHHPTSRSAPFPSSKSSLPNSVPSHSAPCNSASHPSNSASSSSAQASSGPSTSATSSCTNSSTSSPPGSSGSGRTTWRDIVKTARFSDMVAYKARLQTFATWPLLSPTPQDLARAGLFRETKPSSLGHPSSTSSPRKSTRTSPPPANTCTSQSKDFVQGCSTPGGVSPGRGCGDGVRCFWCGERIHRWKSSDDPVLEHARLSPRCRYVMLLLGHQLHRDVIEASQS